jgi:hypothetical protein
MMLPRIVAVAINNLSMLNKEKIEKWEELWSEFVIKEMTPNSCGFLRFKFKDLIRKCLQSQQEEWVEKIEKLRKKQFIEYGIDLDKGTSTPINEWQEINCEYNNAIKEVLQQLK